MNKGFADHQYLADQIKALKKERDQFRAQLEELRKAVRGVTFDIPGSIEMDGIRVIKWDWWLERRKELEAAIEPKKPEVSVPLGVNDGKRGCKDCKFWNAPERATDAGFGTCDGIPYQERTSLAYHKDYESYASTLYTKAEFGCVLFDRKLEVPNAK